MAEIKGSDPEEERKASDRRHVLETVLQCELAVVCSPQILATFNTYYKAVEDLTVMCHMDANFTHIMTDSPYGGLPPGLTIQNSEQSGLLELVQPRPSMTALCVSRHAVVLSSPSMQYLEKRPLVFYTTAPAVGSLADHVQLLLSSRTQSHMTEGAFGLEDSKHFADVIEDDSQAMRFSLSARKFGESFAAEIPNFLSSFRSSLAVLDKNADKIPMVGIGSGGKNLSCASDEVYAMTAVPALFHPEWPDKCFSWITRKRPSGWPPQSLVQDVVKHGCHVVPASVSPERSEDEKACPQGGGEWKLCFAQAEKILFKSLSYEDKQAAFIFHTLIKERRSIYRGVITEDHVRALILWAYEDFVVSTQQQLPLLTRVMHILQKFTTALVQGCPHYFIPDVDLFQDIPREDLRNVHVLLSNLLDEPWTLVLNCQSLPYSIYTQKRLLENLFFTTAVALEQAAVKQVKEQLSSWSTSLSAELIQDIQHSLHDSFHNAVQLYMLTSCAQTDRGRLDEAIVVQRTVLRLVQDASIEDVLFSPYADIVLSQLASLYLVKSVSVISQQEKDYFQTKACQLLQQSKMADLSLARTRLANFYLMTNRVTEAEEEVTKLLELIEAESQPDTNGESSSHGDSDEVDEAESEDASRGPAGARHQHHQQMAHNIDVDLHFWDALWQRWLSRKYMLDVAYSRTMRPTSPSAIRRALPLAKWAPLGVRRGGVSILSPLLHTRLLQALCRARVRDTNATMAILHGLQAVTAHPELVVALEAQVFHDVTERRLAAFHVAIAGCYLELDKTEPARQALRTAMQVYPTPRSPAVALYAGIALGDTLDSVTNSAKVLAVTSALSVAVDFVNSQM